MQVQLDRAGFGPGVIDGRDGRFLTAAAKGFQISRGLRVTGELDVATQSELKKDNAPALIMMVLKDEALAADYTPAIPSKIADQAALPSLGYRNLLERLAERFHTTPQVLLALNPGLRFPKAGMELRLPGLIPTDRAYASNLSPQWRDTLATLNVGAQQPNGAKIVVVNPQAFSRSTMPKTTSSRNFRQRREASMIRCRSATGRSKAPHSCRPIIIARICSGMLPRPRKRPWSSRAPIIRSVSSGSISTSRTTAFTARPNQPHRSVAEPWLRPA